MNSRLVNIYHNMKRRCYKPSDPAFSNYGGRGIKVCKEWRDSDHKTHKGFLAFKKWAMENGYKEGLTLDRIDVNKGYSPENCRWVTRKVQNRNKRNTIFLTAFGKTQSLGDWAEEKGMTVKAIEQRLKKCGFSAEKALSQIDFRCNMITYKGETKTLSQWAEKLGINLQTLNSRINLKKWTIERAFETEVKKHERRNSNETVVCIER